MSGVATLFTREFFEAARARLTPDGLLCQWAHTYDISQDDLQSIVRTFASVFPQGTMWLVGEADLLLIGGAGRRRDGRGSTGLAAAAQPATGRHAGDGRHPRRRTRRSICCRSTRAGRTSSTATAGAR